MSIATAAGPASARRTVGLWTPSSPAPGLFPKRMARAQSHLRSLGWDVVAAPSAYAVDGLGAAPPRVIARELHALLADPRVDFVLAAAGGYTCDLVLPYLDYPWIAAQGKPIVGYSDVSNLLWALHARGVRRLVHGPMAVSEFGHFDGVFPQTLASLERALDGRHAGALRPPRQWTDDDPWWDRDDERAPGHEARAAVARPAPRQRARVAAGRVPALGAVRVRRAVPAGDRRRRALP